MIAETGAPSRARVQLGKIVFDGFLRRTASGLSDQRAGRIFLTDLNSDLTS